MKITYFKTHSCLLRKDLVIFALITKILMNFANAGSRQIMIVCLAAIMIYGIAFLPSVAQATEYDVTTKEVDTIIQKTVNGKSVIETKKTEITFKQPIISKISGCDITEGGVPWSTRNSTNKITPDLQRVIDSGAEEICVVILIPHYLESKEFAYDMHPEYFVTEFPIDKTKIDPNKEYLTPIEVSEKRKQYEEESSSKSYSHYFNIVEFLKENDARIEPTYKRELKILEDSRRSLYSWPYDAVNAAISTDKISELVKMDDVDVVDLYGKKSIFDPPYKKIQPNLQAHLDVGIEIIPVDIKIQQEQMWPNRWPSSTYPTPEERSIRSKELVTIHHQRQQSILDFLNQNNVKPNDVSDATGIISAHIPSSLISELVKIEQVKSLRSYEQFLYLASNNDTIKLVEESIKPNPENLLKIIINDDSTTFHISDDSIGIIPIPDDITTNFITVMINNNTTHNYSITSDTPRLIIFDEINIKSKQNITTEKQYTIPSVKEQLQNGTLPKDIQCKKETILMLKSSTGNLYCITHPTAEKLQCRGWGMIQ